MDGYTASQRGLLLMSPSTDSAASEMNRMHGEAAEASAELQRLREGIRHQIGVLDRTAARYREYRLNGQAQLWDMAANNLRRLIGEEGQ